MSNIFVASTGFNKKTLTELLLEYQSIFQGIWGDDIDLDPRGPIGQLCAQLAKRDADIWDGAEEIYNSRNPASATGVSQDNIYLENGIQRLIATATVVRNVVLLGDNSTIINSGKLAQNPNQSVQYSLDSTVTIDKTACREGRISIPSVTVGNHYIIIINSVSYDYTALGGDEVVDVLTGLKTLIDAGSWTGEVALIESNTQIQLFDTTNYSFDVNSNLAIENIGNVGNFTCTTTGANSLPANSLTEIGTPVTGWRLVYNPDAGVTGRDKESDDDFRLRRETSINNGAATDDAIREAILNNVSNVTGCKVISNRTNITDVEGRPPHSFECIVSGGTDADVANMILDKQGEGCESYGNTTVICYDSQGYESIIKFSRAVPKYIWVRISRNFYSEEIYPDDGDSQIKSAIVTWSLNTTNIDVGKDIIRQRLSTPIYSVPGIKDIVIEIAETDNPLDIPVYAEADISIDARGMAGFNVSRITVQNI